MNGAWERVEIAGKSADAYDPPGKDRPRFGVLFLHGIGLETLRDRPHFTRVLDELGLACLCPHGQRSWWADRICPEFDAGVTPERHLLQQVLPCCDQRWGLKPGAVGLLGISMGGQAVLRLAFKYPDRFPAAAGISSALDYHELYGSGMVLDEMYDSKEQCRQDTALLHIHPSNHPPHLFFCIDPDDELWYRGNDRLVEKLNALGIEHQADLQTRAGGHSWDYFNHMAERSLRFLHAGLVQQSRRLL
jgi:S-formylglutathione hydrolase